MAGRFSVEAVFKAVDRITAPVSRMQNRVGKLTRSMQRGFARVNKAIGKIGAGIKRAGMAAAVGIGALGAAIVNVTTAGANFGRAIGSAAAKFPEKIKRGTEAFKALERAARDVGKTTEFTSVQAAQGLNFLAKAGFSAEFSMKALRDIVDFATAAEIEFAEAADIASDAIGAFGLDSENTEKKMEGLKRIMDVMSKTANSTNTSVSELFEAVKKGAPIATKAGASLETFSAIMGVLAGSGIKAELAGTASKNITLALAGIGNQAAKTFKKLRIPLADANGDLRDQLDVLDDLRKSMAGFGQKQQVEIIAAIFGKIPIAAASNLLADTTGKVRSLRKELEAAGGSSKRTAAFIRDDVKGSLDGLNSAIEGVKISIFTLNEGPLKNTIDSMTEWVRTNEKLIATNIGEFVASIVENFDEIVTVGKQIVGVILAFVALSAALKVAAGITVILNTVSVTLAATMAIVKGAVAAYALIAGGLTKALTLLRVAVIVLNIAFAANPVGLVVIAIAAFIGLAAAVILAWDPVTKFFSNLMDQIKSVTGGVFDTIGRIGSAFGFGDDDESKPGASKQVISPQERAASSIEDRRTTSTSEVTIRDETGRAEVTGGKMGAGLKLQSTGGF